MTRKPPPPGTIGHIVYTAREKKGWRQNDLRQHSGVSQPRISQIERNDFTNVTGATLTGIAQALGIDATEMQEGRLVDVRAPALNDAVRTLEQRLDATNLQRWISVYSVVIFLTLPVAFLRRRELFGRLLTDQYCYDNIHSSAQ